MGFEMEVGQNQRGLKTKAARRGASKPGEKVHFSRTVGWEKNQACAGYSSRVELRAISNIFCLVH